MYSNAIKEAVVEFVTKYGEGIIAAITDSGLFFPAVVGQKALETGWGKSKLASEYNNWGGIKNYGSTPLASGSVMMDTTEYKNGSPVKVKEPFAVFPSIEIGFKAYVQILKADRYVKAGVYEATTPEEQILCIAKAGYTTTPAKEYLRRMQPTIDAVRDIYKFGKISSEPEKQTDPGIDFTKPQESLRKTVIDTINSALPTSLTKGPKI